MSFINFEIFEDMFEGDYNVSERSDGSWQYAFTSGDFAGHQLALSGLNLSGEGDVPIVGTITGIAVSGPGLNLSVGGLALSAARFADELELGASYEDDDDQGEDDEDQDEDEDDQGDGDDDEDGDDQGENEDDDDLFGGGDDDNMDGGDGDDDIEGGDGEDDLDGGAGNDDVYGGNDDDVIDGGAGDDDLQGDGGDDVLAGGSGLDIISGGLGSDTASYTRSAYGVTVNLTLGTAFGNGKDVLRSIEDLVGSVFKDAMAGNLADNDLDGHRGDDDIKAGGGDDDVDGGMGDDDLQGNAGDDDLDGELGDDDLAGGLGNDDLDGGAGDDDLQGGSGSDDLDGGIGSDTMDGGAGSDDFLFDRLTDSGTTVADRDVINGFDHVDDVDLSAIDANAKLAGNQSFTFGDRFTGAAGQLQWDKLDGDSFLVTADVNGDSVADFSIRINEVGQLYASDFLL
jgi:Ca2+-binding RTX toxin-like protein